MKSTLLIACLAVMAMTLFVVDAPAQYATRLQGFIENKGQWPADVKFLALQPGAHIWITTSGVTVDEYAIDEKAGVRTGKVTRPSFGVDNSNLEKNSADVVGTMSFFLGNDKTKWVTANVYASVKTKLPTTSERYVDFSINKDGLVQAFELNTSKLKSTETTQDVSTTTSTVYATYLGTASDDRPTGIKYLTSGDILVVGYTTSLTFPTVTGGYKTTTGGASDGFLVRLDKKLQKVKTYTLIGGNSDDKIRAITKDEGNTFFICGETTSPNFPITAGVSGQLYKSQLDGFVSAIDSTMSKLLMSSYLGGNKDDQPKGIGIDLNGTIYVCGATTSTANFPVTFPVTITRRDWRGRETTEPGGGANLGQTDGFLTSMSQAGSIIQSRFFGREGIEFFTSMAIDGSSGIYVTGSTTSSNFETAPTSGFFSSGRVPYDRTFNGGLTDGFVAKFNNELALAKSDDGTYSTYFGGSGEEEVRGVFVDALGRAYVVGVTNSPNLPAIGTLNTTAFGQQDIFLAVFSDDGRELNGCTYFGGTGIDDVIGVEAFTGLTTALMYGSTASNDFPIAGAGASSARFGTSDGFISVLNLSSVTFSGLISGLTTDAVRCASMDNKGDVYYAMQTESDDLRTHDSAYSRVAGDASMYIAKHAFGTLDLTVPRGGESWCLASNQTISWQVAGMQAGEKYYIEMSQDNGATWSLLVKDLTGTNYQWKPQAATTPAGDKYLVRVSTSRGHVSKSSEFAFVLPPTIATQPKPVSVCDGAKVTLSVEATGGNLRYQWRRNTTPITGATNATFEIATLAADSVGNYDVVITGKCSPNVTSTPAVVALSVATSVTTQPANVTIKEQQTLTLTVVAAGSALTYQWQKDGYDIAGATQATYTKTNVAKSDAGTYRCVITGGCGNATSADAVVVINDINGVEDEGVFAGSTFNVVGPNPSSTEVNVSLNLRTMVDVTFRIVDMHGSIVWTSPTVYYREGTSNVVIPVGQLTPGVYAIEARMGSSVMRNTISVAR